MGNTVEELKNAGNKLFGAKDYAAAVVKYSAALELQPERNTVLGVGDFPLQCFLFLVN